MIGNSFLQIFSTSDALVLNSNVVACQCLTHNIPHLSTNVQVKFTAPQSIFGVSEFIIRRGHFKEDQTSITRIDNMCSPVYFLLVITQLKSSQLSLHLPPRTHFCSCLSMLHRKWLWSQRYPSS